MDNYMISFVMGKL